ncbi:MAG: thrombospondin type 3 repeat-containing protein [Moraxellaceae bacterium]
MNTLQNILKIAAMTLVLGLTACSADDPAPDASGGTGSPTSTTLDNDGDGLVNASDNCIGISNATQADMNGDGVGDACDDSDGDATMDAVDNCPLVANASQADTDNDGIGNACEGDFDGDTVLDATDNCPSVSNLDQADANGNGVGDACDLTRSATDTDGDGVLNVSDNCPTVINQGQGDADSNGVGDVCDVPIKDICGAGFRPLLAPEVTTVASSNGLLSMVSNVGALTDTDADNYASMSAVANVLGLLGTSYVGVHTMELQPAGHVTGFVVSEPTQLLSLGVLTGVTVQTLQGATVSETFTPSGGLLSLSLLGSGVGEPALVSFTPTKSYDGLRVNIGGAVGVLSSLRVHAACSAL